MISLLLLAFLSSADQACFNQPGLPRFLRVQSEFQQSTQERLQAVNQSCAEIQNPEVTYQLPEHARSTFMVTLGSGLMGRATGAFSFMNSTAEERAYKARLEEIKKNPNRYERIQQVYSLVAETMGPYDHNLTLREENFTGTFLQPASPTAILARVQAKGTGGVCRHHADLLSWSLLQVARPVGETAWGLTENSFSMTTKNGCDETGCHTWIQLNLPFQTDRGLQFENVDLDTTWYKTPTVLHNRLNGFSPAERQRILNVCRAVISCLVPPIKSDAIKIHNQPSRPIIPNPFGVRSTGGTN